MSEARAVPEDQLHLLALAVDRCTPAVTRLLGWRKLQLQKMFDNGGDSASKFAPVPLAQAFDLLGKIFVVQPRVPASAGRAQRLRLRLRPLEEIPVVKARLGVRDPGVGHSCLLIRPHYAAVGGSGNHSSPRISGSRYRELAS